MHRHHQKSSRKETPISDHDESHLEQRGFAEERKELLAEFCALPRTGDVLAWQRRLANAIIRGEHESRGENRDDAKRHRHLLRVIGDALVHELLPAHTIRTLSRAPGKPAHIASQGDDFEFVFERAREIRLAGSIPILADLTTLIGVGDIIAVGENSIAIVECKNRPSPSGTPSGRVARQKARGEQAARYLQSSVVDEGDKTRVAVAYDLPEPDYEQVALLLEASITSPQGIATRELGDRDVLLACTKDVDRSELLSAIQIAMPPSKGDSAMAFAFLNELVESSSHRRPSPSNYPLSAELRWRLLEGDLQLIRIVDTSRLACAFSVGEIDLHLVPRQGLTGLEVEVNSNALEHPVVVTSELAEICVWTPVSVERVKTAIVQHISSTLASLIDVDGDEAILNSHLADGDDVTYVTRYRSEGGEVR